MASAIEYALEQGDIALATFALAQRTLNLSTREPERMEYVRRFYSYQPNEYQVQCSTQWQGVFVVYVQVYKSDTQGICQNLRLIGGGGYYNSAGGGAGFEHARGNLPVIVFSVVRDPLSHLISGYSEMEFRIRHDHARFRHPEQALRQNHTEDEIATRFVRELVACRGRTVSTNLMLAQHDIHVAPQIAFVRSGLARLGLKRLDFVGRLESIVSEWDALGKIIGRRAHEARPGTRLGRWPAFRLTANKHVRTDNASGNAPRSALEHVLNQNRDLALATCLLLLPDYACFNIEIPETPAACHSSAALQEAWHSMKHADLCAPAAGAASNASTN